MKIAARRTPLRALPASFLLASQVVLALVPSGHVHAARDMANCYSSVRGDEAGRRPNPAVAGVEKGQARALDLLIATATSPAIISTVANPRRPASPLTFARVPVTVIFVYEELPGHKDGRGPVGG